jgi:hypothetical protein
LLRRLGIGVGQAVFGSAVLLLNPLYLHLSFSFMTDVAFLALLLAAVLAAVAGLQQDQDRLLAISMLVSDQSCWAKTPLISTWRAAWA